MTDTNPLVSAFWSATEPPAPRHRHYRDAAIEDAPERAGDQCGIPTMHVEIAEIGLPSTGGIMEERGTLYCAVCPEYPQGCKQAATPERLAAFRAHLAALKTNNLAAKQDRKRALGQSKAWTGEKWCTICGKPIGANGGRGLCARHYSERKRNQEEAA